MSADRNIVGAVGEDETSLRVRHQPRQHVAVAAVAARNPMSAERENVTRPGDRLERGVRLERAVLGDLGLLINRDLVDLDFGEPRDHHRHVLEDEFIQLDLQRAEIPVSLFAEAIDGDPKKAPLGRRQMARHDTGQAPQAYLTRCLDPGPTVEHAAVLIDQNRYVEAERAIAFAISRTCAGSAVRTFRAGADRSSRLSMSGILRCLPFTVTASVLGFFYKLIFHQGGHRT